VEQQASVRCAAGQVPGAGVAIGATAATAAAKNVLQVRRSRTSFGQLPAEAVAGKNGGMIRKSGQSSDNGNISVTAETNSITFLTYS